jgi:hypothetical protein
MFLYFAMLFRLYNYENEMSTKPGLEKHCKSVVSKGSFYDVDTRSNRNPYSTIRY